MTPPAFSTLKLHPHLLKNLASLAYEQMTPIQAQSLPPILAGKDVMGQAKTGSGKTAAFGLGLLEKLDIKSFNVQALVLCPTRELADQVAKEIRKLARTIQNIKVLSLCGGMPIGPQISALAHGVHIIVGTPGRIEDHLRKGRLQLENVNTLVLDEADRMLDMGFQVTLDAIIQQVPKQRQTLLFSATFSEQIQSIARHIMQEPIHVKVDTSHDDSSIRQHFYKVEDEQQRIIALRLLLLQLRVESTVVFCNTKRETQAVANELKYEGFSVLALHGDLEQRDREEMLVRFANKSTSVLVATDVAARGLDIDALDAVINYHIAHGADTHVHRIGRTGRAGSQGMAYSLFTEKETYKVATLETDVNPIMAAEPLPPLSLLEDPPMQALMRTLQISGGKKQKLRPGDILGALTGDKGISGKQVGKIHIFDNKAYVAIEQAVAKSALKKLSEGKLKGRSFKVRLIRS